MNAVTRDAERTKVKKYKALCNQRGLTFVPVIFTTSGGMGDAFKRQPEIWHPMEEDAEMKISEWVSRKRKLMWMARFGAKVAKCNALTVTISRSAARDQNIADFDSE